MQELKNRLEKVEGIHRPGSFVSFDHTFNPSTILNSELREVLATPRKIPRQFREEIAEILIYELFSEKGYEIKDENLFMGKFGVFFPILLNMRSLEEWNEIKTLASINKMAGVFILRTLLDELFSLLSDFEKIEYEFSKKFSKNLEKTLVMLERLVNETQAKWEKKELQAIEKSSQWWSQPNASYENSLKSHENFLNTEYDLKNQESHNKIREDQKIGEDKKTREEQQIRDERKVREEHHILEEQQIREEQRVREEQKVRDNQETQKDFLKDFQSGIWKHSEQSSQIQVGSEKLASMTREFISSEKAAEILDSVIGERVAAKIEELIHLLEDNLEMLEILSMLFPGRAWDHSLQALHREYFKNLDKYAALFRKSSDLHKILEQVGRIELEYGSKKLNLSPYSRNEVHSITFSGDLQTLLPVEAVKLKNPLLKRKFYADMLEGKLLTYQLRGQNWNSDTSGKKRKGPVVALVDTSASMRGSPETLAKAVLLAVTRKMLKEGRDVKVILFSSKWQTVEIELTDKKRMGQEFLEFLKYTFGGGTDFNTALRAGLKAMKAEKAFEGADLLFLTDGVSELSERPLIREWNEIKVERKARIFSLIIGNYDAGGLEQVSDHTYIIRNPDYWSIGESPASFVKAISKPLRF